MRRDPGDGGTRERILETAEESFAERGYHGTRVHEIASRVGIQKASLFHYFESKSQLYRAVLAEGLGETGETIRRVLAADTAPLDTLRALLTAYVDTVAAHPARTKILLRQLLGDVPQDPDAAHPLLQVVVDFIQRGQDAGHFAPIDRLALVLGVAGMVAFFFTSAPILAPEWASDPCGTAAVERVKGHIVDVVTRCLSPRTSTRTVRHEPEDTIMPFPDRGHVLAPTNR